MNQINICNQALVDSNNNNINNLFHLNQGTNSNNTNQLNNCLKQNIVNLNVDINTPNFFNNRNNCNYNDNTNSQSFLFSNNKANDYQSSDKNSALNLNSIKDDDEISNISSFRKELISESSDWKNRIHQKVETRFNDFRRKMRNKIFEKKFEMLIDDCGPNNNGVSGFSCSNDLNNNNSNHPYDINKFIEKQTSGEQLALETIKRYKEMGLIREDFYEFENFDFRNDICTCKICDDYIYLIDKRIIICSNNCFSFAVDPGIFSWFNLDMVMELFFKCLFEHRECKSQIEIFYFGDEYQQKQIHFECSKCLFS